MSNIFDNLYITRCSGINNRDRCYMKIISFTPGIYFCSNHGDILNNSRVNGIVKSDLNSINKSNYIDYLNSSDYKSFLRNRIFKKKVYKLLYDNFLFIDQNIIYYITDYI